MGVGVYGKNIYGEKSRRWWIGGVYTAQMFVEQFIVHANEFACRQTSSIRNIKRLI